MTRSESRTVNEAALEGSSVQISTLANGLRVVTDARSDVASSAVGVWVDAGARHETAAENGVAHMLEHMAFKGTERRSARVIAEEIEAVGGHLNAYTSREHTAYFARVLGDDLPLSVDILADILQHSSFLEDELARERTVVVQEIGQTEDTPDDIVFDHLQEQAFPGQPLGRSILGTVEKVQAMDRARLGGFMDKHYVASSLVLCAAGAVDHDGLVALAERHFADLPTQTAGAYEPAVYGGGEVRAERDLEQVHFSLALPGLSYTDPDFYTAQALSTVLGGGMSSRLFQEVRESRGLCYAVFTFTQSFADGGVFCAYAGTGEDEVAELVPVLCDELVRVAADAGEDEVARARAQLKASTLMALESSSARAEQLARQMLIFGRPIPPAEVVSRIEAVDAAAVRRVAGRILSAGAPTVAAIGPLRRLASYDDIAAKFH